MANNEANAEANALAVESVTSVLTILSVLVSVAMWLHEQRVTAEGSRGGWEFEEIARLC